MKTLCLLITIFLLNSCGEDTFKKAFKLQSLRVLAVTAGKNGALTQAEFDPGDTAVVTVYVSDVEFAQTVTGVIETCSDPGVSYGKEASCENVADRNTSIANITLNTASVSGRTGAMPSFNVTIPNTVLLGRSTADQFNGVNYLVTIRVSTPDGQAIRTFKRLTVTTRTTKNTNPTLGTILFNGNAFTSYPGEGDLSLSTTSTEESYQFQSAGGEITNLTEQLNIAWYISDGELSLPVTKRGEVTRFKPGEKGTLTVVAVIRDGRGGMEVAVKRVP